MSYYRRVDCRMWGDAKFRRLSEQAKLLWVYLLTGPETTSLPGLIVCGRAQLAESLGWLPQRLGERFGELSSLGMAKADWDARLIWLPNAVKYNLPANPNVVWGPKGWAGHWGLIPECSLQIEAWHALRSAMEQLPQPFLEGFLRSFPQPSPQPLPQPLPPPSRCQDQDQDQDQDQEQKESRATLSPVPADAGDIDSGPSPKEIQAVYEHYLATMGKTTATYHLTPKRRAKIVSRLKEWDVASLCEAIDACSRSDFHMGSNGSGKVYNDLADHILRSNEKVEGWVFPGRPKP